MKSMSRILAAFLTLVLILAAWGTAAAEQAPRTVETAADAEEWMAGFLGEHPEEMEGAWAMTAQMEAAVAQMGGVAGFAKQMAESLGTPSAIGAAYEEEMNIYKLYHIPCVYPAISLDWVLVVQDGAIAGLQTAPYTGTAEEPAEPAAEEQAEPAAFDSLELALPVDSLGELPGTLTLPQGEGPFPVVILLQGSGPSDRDETLGSLKPFRDIAEGLAARGVAVYRFDKRTYVFGTQLAEKKDISLSDEYIEDAVNAVQLVAAQEKIDPERIFVLGHSLGGNAVPAVARALEQAPVKACGFIMMAASPRPLDVLMREQYDFLYSLMDEVTPEMQAEKDQLFAELDLLQDPDALAEDDRIAGVYASYWKWLADYDILEAAKEITLPVLLLQGEEDYQVTMADFGLWQEALGDRENWHLVSFPGLTHVFMPGQKSEGSAAYAREARVDDGVIAEIAGFVTGR